MNVNFYDEKISKKLMPERRWSIITQQHHQFL